MAGVKGRSGGKNKKPINYINCAWCGVECSDRTKSRAKTKFCSNLCSVRYAALTRIKPLDKRICGYCSKEFFVKSHRKKLFCSRRCSNTARTKTEIQKYLLRKKTCLFCKKEFAPKDARRGYCSRACADLERRANKIQTELLRCKGIYRLCVICGESMYVYGLKKTCSAACRVRLDAQKSVESYQRRNPEKIIQKNCGHCGKQFCVTTRIGIAERARWCSKKCAKANDNHRHRGIPKGMLGTLILRQSGRCAICKHKFKNNADMKPTIDHIIPRSKGGSNEETNLQAACFRCNTIKGDKLNVQLRLCV